MISSNRGPTFASYVFSELDTSKTVVPNSTVERAREKIRRFVGYMTPTELTSFVQRFEVRAKSQPTDAWLLTAVREAVAAKAAGIRSHSGADAAARAAVAAYYQSSVVEIMKPAPPSGIASHAVATHMQKDFHTLRQDAGVESARRLTTSSKYFLVLNDAGLAGMVSSSDLLTTRATYVKDCMKSPATAIAATTTMEDAATIMMDRGIGFLPVIGDGIVVGYVTRDQLAKLGLLAS